MRATWQDQHLNLKGKRFFAIIFLVIFILSLSLTCLVQPAEQIYFRADPIQAALEQQSLSERLPALLAADSEEGLPKLFESQSQLQIVVRNLTQLQIQQIYSILLPVDWVRTQVGSLNNQVWAYLNSDSATLSLELDLWAVQNRFAGGGGSQIAEILINGWPVCTTDQVLTIAGIGTNPDASFPNCQPPAQYTKKTLAHAQSLVLAAALVVPDRIDLMKIGGMIPGRSIYEQARVFITAYRTFRNTGKYAWLVAVLSYFGLLITQFPRMRSFLKLSGTGIALSGILVLLAIFHLRVAFGSLSLAPFGGIFLRSAALVQIFHSALNQVVGRYAEIVTTLGLVCLLVGALCILVGLIGRK